MELKLNGTHQLLVYADDVNLLEDNIDTIKKNTETLIDPSKEVGLEVNPEKTKYMLLSCHENSDQNHNITIGNRLHSRVWHPVCVYHCNMKWFRLTQTTRLFNK
jgi:hypothetical protein